MKKYISKATKPYIFKNSILMWIWKCYKKDLVG